MRITLLLLLFVFCLPVNGLRAQSPWATRVVAVQFGTGQSFGQDSADFPANVLGPVAPTAGPTAPASSPDEVVSLGRGGWIVLGFAGPIVDGPGPDFTVFENAFLFGSGSVFDEWLTVEVSAGGQNWVPFPYDSVTGAGMAGRTPTAAAPVDYGNPAESGGDAFDLAAIGVDSARFVRLTDATRYQSPDRLAAELDAVRRLNGPAITSRPAQRAAGPPWRVRTQAGRLHVSIQRPVDRLQAIDLQGRILKEAKALRPGGSLRLRTQTGVVLLRAITPSGHFKASMPCPPNAKKAAVDAAPVQASPTRGHPGKFPRPTAPRR